jgi:protease I
MTVAALRDVGLDALYLPGGIFGPIELRQLAPTLALVRDMMAEDRIVASICHAQWILISAEVVRGRRITGPRDMIADMRNAGAIYEEKAGIQEISLRDGNLFTSPGFMYLPDQFRDLMPALSAIVPRGKRGCSC